MKRLILRWLGHQSWLPPGRNAIVSRFGRETSHHTFCTDFFGMKYEGDLSNFIDWNVYMYGCYDQPQLMLLTDIVKTIRSTRSGPVTFVDIGANVGHHSLYMSRQADSVFSFEPWGHVRALLEQKLRLNRIDNVRCFGVALGDTNGELGYLEPDLDGGNLGWGRFLQEGEDARPSTALSTRTGDLLFAEAEIRNVSLIKIDVEGFEGHVIRGLREVLERDRPPMTIELSEHGVAYFGSESAFRQALYPRHVLHSVQDRRNGYRLAPFTWGPCDHLLVCPEEMKLARK